MFPESFLFFVFIYSTLHANPREWPINYTLVIMLSSDQVTGSLFQRCGGWRKKSDRDGNCGFTNKKRRVEQEINVAIKNKIVGDFV